MQMEETTLIAIVGISGTLLGSVITALITTTANFKVKTFEAENHLYREKLLKRENLYTEYLTEIYSQILISVKNKHETPEPFTNVLSAAARIKLISEELGAEAIHIITVVMRINQKKVTREESNVFAKISTITEKFRIDIESFR